MRHRVQFAALDVSDRHTSPCGEFNHVTDPLLVSSVPDKDQLKPALPRLQRCNNRLSAFQVLHSASAQTRSFRVHKDLSAISVPRCSPLRKLYQRALELASSICVLWTGRSGPVWLRVRAVLRKLVPSVGTV